MQTMYSVIRAFPQSVGIENFYRRNDVICAEDLHNGAQTRIQILILRVA